MKGADSVVWVLDASELINSKKKIAGQRQWTVFKALEEMVRSGAIAMPKQVILEVAAISHPDVPGVWAQGVQPFLRHPVDPTWESMAEVMAKAGQLIDPNDVGDPADPWVLALALDLRTAGHRPCCVTDDHIDRPPRISLVTACNRFDIESCSLEDFLKGCGIEGSSLPGP